MLVQVLLLCIVLDVTIVLNIAAPIRWLSQKKKVCYHLFVEKIAQSISLPPYLLYVPLLPAVTLA